VGKGRSIAVWALVVVATLLLFVSSMTVWTKRQLLDNEAWTNSSAKLLANDQIRATIANRVVDLLYQRVDVSQQLQQQLPPQAKGAAPVIAGAVQNAAVRVVNTFLSTARAQELWKDANSRAHTAIVNVLEGKDAGPVSTANGDVVLDLRPLIAQVATRLGVADRLSERAPPDAGQIVLLRSDQLSAAQTAVKTLKALSIWLVILVLVLYAIAVYLARGKRRTILMAIGTGILICGLLLFIIRRVVGNAIIDSLVKTDANEPAAKAIWLIETDLMKDIAIALLAYGALLVVAAYLAGPGRWAVAVRRWLAPYFREHVVAVYTVAVLLFLLLVIWGPTNASRQLLGTVILGVLFLVGIEVWRRQTIREFPAEGAPAPPPKDETPPPGQTATTPGG
jgi:hypothetical protein